MNPLKRAWNNWKARNSRIRMRRWDNARRMKGL